MFVLLKFDADRTVETTVLGCYNRKTNAKKAMRHDAGEKCVVSEYEEHNGGYVGASNKDAPEGCSWYEIQQAEVLD